MLPVISSVILLHAFFNVILVVGMVKFCMPALLSSLIVAASSLNLLILKMGNSGGYYCVELVIARHLFYILVSC